MGDKERRISAALLGKPKSKEQVIKQSRVWEKVRPLFLRGGLAEEIAGIANFSLKQVSNAIYRKRLWHSLPVEVFSKENIKERKRRASSKKPRRLDRRTTIGNRSKSLEFAKRLIAQKMIGDDLSYWERMVPAYKSKGRNLPVEFSERLRLEVFLQAISKARSGDHSIISAYQGIGVDIGYVWFDKSLAEEEDFIAKFEDEELGRISEDRLGYYREDEEGRWRYPVAFGESGGIIFDSSRAALKRELARSNNIGN